MNYWAGLHRADFQEQLKEGVNILLSMACQMLAGQPRTHQTTLNILPIDEDDGQEEEES